MGEEGASVLALKVDTYFNFIIYYALPIYYLHKFPFAETFENVIHSVLLKHIFPSK